MKKRFVGVRSIGAAVAALSIAVITLPAVSSTLSSAVGAVPGLSALSASPASAAGALNCTGYIYDVTTSGALSSIVAGSPYTVASTGVKIGPSSGGDVNALALASDGSEGYTANFTPSSGHTTVYAYDFLTATQTTYSVPIASGVTEVVAGAVDPLNGYYYYGGWNPSSGSTSLSLYAMSPTGTAAEVGTVQAPSGSPTFLSGDMAFDGSGNLYILAGYSVSGGYNAHVLVVPGPLGTSGSSTLAATNLTPSGLSTTSTEVYDGIAFGSNSVLYAGSESGSFVSINANTGTVATLPSLGSNSWADMASCQYNGSLTLQKNVVGRAASSDQFNLSITGGGITGGNTATTSGSATGVQAAKAGPVVGIPAQVYTITETAASGSLSNYSSTYSCLNGSAAFASGSGTTATLPAFPAATTNTGAQIVCTFTNTPATLSISKATTTTSVTNVGDTINYTYTVKNTGPVTMTGVTVADNPIAPAGALTTGPTCTGLTGPTGSCTSTSSTTLLSNQTATFTATYKVTQADLNNGSVNDTSTATGTPPGGGTITGTSNQVTVPANQNTGLTITKTPSPTTVSTVGTPVTYTFVVTNTSNVTLNGVSVADTQTAPAGGLASGPTCQSLSTPSGSCSGSSTTLLPNQSATFTAVYDTTQADLNNGSIHDSATASGTTDLGKGVTSNMATATVTVTQTPGLTTVKATTTSTVSSVGTVIPYTFTVTNSGNVTLTNVSVTDTGTAPAGNVTATCQNLTNPAGTCTGTSVPSLAPGQIAHFTGSYTVTQADLNNGSIQDSATSTGTNPPSIGGTTTSLPSSATVGVTQSPGLTIVKSTSTISVDAPNQTITYNYVVTNTGNVTLTNVGVTDLPISPAGALTSGPTCNTLTNPSASSCTSTSSTTLLPNQVAHFSGVYTVTQADINNGSINDTSKTTGTNPAPLGGTTTANSNEVTVPTEQTNTLSVVKASPTVNYSAVGNTISYTYTVTDTGNTTLTNVSVTDNPVSPATGSSVPQCQSLTSPSGTCSGATVASLAPSQVAHFTATYAVSQLDLNNGSVSDTSTANGTGPSGAVTAGSNEVTVPAVQTNTLSVVKASPTVNYSAVGNTISYTYTVTDTGNTTLTNVSVTDNPVSPATGSSVPQCQSLTSPSGTCSGATVASLAPSQVAHFTATYAVSQLDLNNGSVSDTSTANGTGPSGAVTAGSNEVTVPAVQTNTLSVVKASPTVNYSAVGNTISYTYTVTDTGNTTLTNVSVTDNPVSPATGSSVPQCQSLTSPSGTCSGATVASLAPSQVAHFTATYAVSQLDLNNGSVSDTSTANGTGPSGAVTAGSNEVTVPAVQTNTLSVVKASPTVNYSAVGNTISYTYTVTDTGNTTLTNVSVTDNPVSPATGSSVPQCQSLTSPSGTCSGATVASLAPSQVAHFTATYAVSQLDLNNGSVSDTSTANGTGPSGAVTAGSNEVTVPAVQTNTLSVVKASPTVNYSAVGNTISYTYTVTDTGNTTLTNVSVTDNPVSPATGSSVPQCQSLTSPSGTCSGATVASLAPSQVAHFTATYAVSQLDLNNGSVSDTSTANGTGPSGAVTAGSNEVTVPAVQTNTLSVVKASPTVNYSAVGNTISYTYTVTDTGNTTLTNVSVTDNPVSPATGSSVPQCQSLTSPSGTCSGATVASLAPSQVAHFTATYAVSQLDLNNGSVSDTSTANGTGPSGAVTAGSNEVTVPAVQTNTLSVVKASPTVNYSAVGNTISYTYTVTDTGNTTLTNVSVTDNPVSPATGSSVPQCQSLTSPSGTCSGATVASLAPSQVAHFTATYAVSQLDLNNGSVSDTSTANGTGPSGAVTAGSNEVTVPAVQTNTLSVVKASPTVNYSAVGNTISYTYTVTDTGNTTLTNVSVTDNPVSPATGSSVPQCQSLTSPSGTCSGATVASLAPSQVAHFTATYAVSQLDLNNGSVSDTSTANGTGPSGAVTAGSNEVTVPAVQTNTLSVVKASPTVNYSAVGNTISYTYTVTDTGNTTLTNVSVTDNPVSPATGSSVPQCQSLTSPSGTCSGATVASLAPSQVAHFTATYAVSQLDLNNGSVSDTSTANGTGPSGAVTAGSNEVTVPAVQTNTLSVVKAANVSSVDAVDQTITYSYAVTDSGNTTLTNVSVTDNPIAPAGATSTPQCVNLTNPSGTCSGATVASLAPGQVAHFTATYSVTQADIDNGSINDTSTANGTGPGSTPVTGPSNQVTVTATQTNTLSIVKSTTTASYSAVGDVIDYTYVVTDTGNTTLSNVSVTDNPVSPATGSSTPQCQNLTNPSGTCSGATVGSLVPGQSATFTATYSASQADLDHGSVSDTSTANATAPDPTPVSATSNEVTVPAVDTPSISVTKTANLTTVSAVGQTVTYTFAVENTGNETLDNVDVTDAQAAPSLDSSLSAITCVDSSDSPVTNGSFSLAPGATATCTATYTVTQADLTNGSVSDTGTVTAEPPTGGTPVTGGSTLTLSVTQVSVTKTVNPTSIVTGSTTPIVYTLTVKNTGTATTTAPVTVTDAAPSGTTLVSSSPACTTTSGGPACTVAVSSGTITWTIPAGVSAGASYTLTFSVTLNSSETSGGSVSNTANWSGPSCGTPVEVNASSAHATTPTTCPTNVVTTSVTAAPATAPATVTPTTAPPVVATAPVTAPSTSPAIAFTGAMLAQEWLIGLGALLLGSALVLLARWRRRSPGHAAK